MAKRGKKRLYDRPVARRFYIPTSIDMQLNELLEDPMTKKTIFGARNTLVIKLLREYLSKVDLKIPTDEQLCLVIKDARRRNLQRRDLDKVLHELLVRLGYGVSIELLKALFPEDYTA